MYSPSESPFLNAHLALTAQNPRHRHSLTPSLSPLLPHLPPLCLLSPLLKSTKSIIIYHHPRSQAPSCSSRARASLTTKLPHAPPLRVPRVSNIELHLCPHQKRAFPIPLVQKSAYCYSTAGYGRLTLLTWTARPRGRPVRLPPRCRAVEPLSPLSLLAFASVTTSSRTPSPLFANAHTTDLPPQLARAWQG